MDLKEINSVNELLEANKEPGYLEEIGELIGEAVKTEGLAAAMQVALNILSNLENIHDDVVEDEMGKNDKENALAWAHDASKINTAIAILSTIGL